MDPEIELDQGIKKTIEDRIPEQTRNPLSPKLGLGEVTSKELQRMRRAANRMSAKKKCARCFTTTALCRSVFCSGCSRTQKKVRSSVGNGCEFDSRLFLGTCFKKEFLISTFRVISNVLERL
jgi:hypothetical protein